MNNLLYYFQALPSDYKLLFNTSFKTENIKMSIEMIISGNYFSIILNVKYFGFEQDLQRINKVSTTAS